MKIMQNIYQLAQLPLKIIDAREVVKAFEQKGYEGIDYYSYNYTESGARPVELIIDDIGTGYEISKHYGNETNAVCELLLDRYIILKDYGKLTHITTNLNAAELSDRYGTRIFSRMKEMFEIVELKGKDKR